MRHYNNLGYIRTENTEKLITIMVGRTLANTYDTENHNNITTKIVKTETTTKQEAEKPDILTRYIYTNIE